MNKKIKNANPYRYDGIDFKSKLERDAYAAFKKADLDVKYEACTFPLQETFVPTVPFYRSTKCLPFRNNKTRVPAITYTPDFIIRHGLKLVIIEMKGFPNDVYPVKKKLFRKFLEGMLEEAIQVNAGAKVLFFELKSMREVNKTIDIIKE